MKDWEVNPDGTLNFDMWHSTGDETQNGIRVNPEMYWSNFARGEARFTVPFASNIGKFIAPYYSNIVSVL